MGYRDGYRGWANLIFDYVAMVGKRGWRKALVRPRRSWTVRLTSSGYLSRLCMLDAAPDKYGTAWRTA